MGACGEKIMNCKKCDIINEVNEYLFPSEGFYSLDSLITQVSKSLCKIIISQKELSSGFLIQLFKGKKKFYCLMTNEHAITKEMIKQKNYIIHIYYDSQSKYRKIKLNPEERIIKDFRDIQIDVTIIEILPKDDISKDYFLLPLIDYMDNYNELINTEISIIQFPRGEMKYSYGIIKYLTQEPKYEFAHNAKTDKGSSGSPIFLKGTTKVIGIHKSGIKLKNANEKFGDFIYPIFTYFRNYSDNKKDSINLNKEIKKSDNYYNNENNININNLEGELNEEEIKKFEDENKAIIEAYKKKLIKKLKEEINQKLNEFEKIGLKLITDTEEIIIERKKIKDLVAVNEQNKNDNSKYKLILEQLEKNIDNKKNLLETQEKNFLKEKEKFNNIKDQFVQKKNYIKNGINQLNLRENKIKLKEQELYNREKAIFNKENKNKLILRGLNDIAATSYMNAILQCLSNSKQLTEYFLNNYKENPERIISNEYYKVIKNLWDINSNNNSYSPNSFIEVLSKENPLFDGIAVNNLKDLINFLLERIHQELNIIDKNDDNIININIFPQIYQTNELAM